MKLVTLKHVTEWVLNANGTLSQRKQFCLKITSFCVPQQISLPIFDAFQF